MHTLVHTLVMSAPVLMASAVPRKNLASGPNSIIEQLQTIHCVLSFRINQLNRTKVKEDWIGM